MATQTLILSPDEWKQLCLLNAGQLQSYLNGIPALTENGSSGLTAEHLTLIDGHLNRGGLLLQGWLRSRAAGSVAAPVKPAAETAPDAPAEATKPTEPNGAAKPRKGGWPKGRKRTRQAKPEAVPQ